MTPELLERLRTAGFPFEKYDPTLENLIEECGRNLDLDIKPDRSNAVQVGPGPMNLIKARGSTPIEAMANLYIMLNYEG